MTDDLRPEPPDPWLAEHLAADRDVPAVDPERIARMEARLRASLDAPVSDAEGAGDAPPPAAEAGASASAAAVTSVAAKVMLASAASLAIGVGAGWLARGAYEPPPAGPAAHAPAPAIAAPADDADEADVEAEAIEAPSDAPAAPMEPAPRPDVERGEAARPDAVAERPRGARSRDEALADENALITRAQSALARGRAAEALAAAREHQQRFPSGQLVEEREALAIRALARLGNDDAARARADRFYARFPNSLLTRAVRAAVGP